MSELASCQEWERALSVAARLAASEAFLIERGFSLRVNEACNEVSKSGCWAGSSQAASAGRSRSCRTPEGLLHLPPCLPTVPLDEHGDTWARCWALHFLGLCALAAAAAACAPFRGSVPCQTGACPIGQLDLMELNFTVAVVPLVCCYLAVETCVSASLSTGSRRALHRCPGDQFPVRIGQNLCTRESA